MRGPRRAACAAAVAALVLPCVRGLAPRGVGPEEAAKYADADSASWRCLDGSGPELPLAAVNDDFCDCPDGSDEPGTAACAGVHASSAQEEALFYCKNEHSQSQYVYRSRVNDGICDCCDGSDEQRPQSPTTCKDTCFEEGRADREEVERQMQAWKHGSALQKEMAEAAEARLDEWRAEAARLQTEMPVLKNDREERKKVLDEARSQLPKVPDPPPPAPPAPPPPPPPATPEEKAFNEAQAAWTAALDALRASTDKMRALEAQFDPVLTDGRRALALLGGECLKHKDTKGFDYSVCFFKSASQSTDTEKDVSLGTWAGWHYDAESKKVSARFEDGTACGNGQARQLKVRFECGREAKIKHVNEPNACQYEASVYHPGGCDPTRPPKDEKRLEAWKGVLALQTELAEKAEAKLDDWKIEAVHLKEEIKAKEADVDEAKTLRDEKKRLRAEAEQAASKPEVPQSPEPPQEEPVATDAAEGSKATDEAPKVSEYAKWMEGAQEAATAPAAAEAGTSPPVSEYAKWMEGSADAPQPSVEGDSNDEPAAETARAETAPEASEAVKVDPLQAAFDAAQEAWTAADGAFWKTKYRLKGLEVSVNDNLAGRLRAFASLEGQCLEKKTADNTFKVCFFRHAYFGSSDETSLGRWLGFDIPTDGSPVVARFGRGATCEAGGVSNQRRSLAVSFKCGPEPKILHAEERKATCIHDMEVEHPGACDASRPPQALEKPARRPKDEL